MTEERDIVERLAEAILADAFYRGEIDGVLAERLIRERQDAAAEITILRAKVAMVEKVVEKQVDEVTRLRAELAAAQLVVAAAQAWKTKADATPHDENSEAISMIELDNALIVLKGTPNAD